MKANELMIGDWVIHDYYKTPIQIKSIPNAEQIYYPIPLTAEILEKNAYPEDGIWYSFGDFYVAPYGDCFVIHIHSYDDKRDFLCRIHYIHEIQHALRLCGLNDLADNFKVE